jgi:hypothetical protein
VVIKPGEGPTSSGDKHGSDDGHGAIERERCAICLVEYQDGDEISWSHNSSCGHAFHRDCIIEWLLAKDECPYCRRNYLRFSNEDQNVFTTDDVMEEMPPPVVRDQESQLDRGLPLFSHFAHEPINPSLPTLRSAASDVENSSGHNNRADSSFGRSGSL